MAAAKPKVFFFLNTEISVKYFSLKIIYSINKCA